MIRGLTPLHAARQILAKLSAIEVNALLQLGIRVEKSEGDGTYLIRLGQHTLQTRSDLPLIPGREYWVDMERTEEGFIRLLRPLLKPKMLQKEGFVPFEADLLAKLSEEKNPAEGLRERIVQTMAATQSREQFLTLSQLLLSLHHGVVTLPILAKGRRTLLQMRKGGKNETLKQKSVEFYAAFNNLGPVEGAIAWHGENRVLKLAVYYPKTLHLLEGAREELTGFSQVTVVRSPEAIRPFWESETSGLLDIRG
ncbi:hypothetical protein [Hydrogenimonas sp.]